MFEFLVVVGGVVVAVQAPVPVLGRGLQELVAGGEADGVGGDVLLVLEDLLEILMGSQVLVGVEVLVVGVGGHVVQVVASPLPVVGGQGGVVVVVEGVSGGDAVPPGEVRNPYRVALACIVVSPNIVRPIPDIFIGLSIVVRFVDVEDRLGCVVVQVIVPGGEAVGDEDNEVLLAPVGDGTAGCGVAVGEGFEVVHGGDRGVSTVPEVGPEAGEGFREGGVGVGLGVLQKLLESGVVGLLLALVDDLRPLVVAACVKF